MLPQVVPDYEMLRQIGRASCGDAWLSRSVTGKRRTITLVQRERFNSDHPFKTEFLDIQRFECTSLRTIRLLKADAARIDIQLRQPVPLFPLRNPQIQSLP